MSDAIEKGESVEGYSKRNDVGQVPGRKITFAAAI